MQKRFVDQPGTLGLEFVPKKDPNLNFHYKSSFFSWEFIDAYTGSAEL